MNNIYYYKNILAKEWVLKNKCKIGLLLIDNTIVYNKDLIPPYFEIQCPECLKRKQFTFYRKLHKYTYICKSCSHKGVKNYFFGKKRSEESKQKQREKMIGRYDGAKNPFFGKCHTSKSKELISKNSKRLSGINAPFYGKKHTKETQEIITKKIKTWRESLTEQEKISLKKKMSNGQKRILAENPEKYKENKRKAAKASTLSHKRYQKNNIEKIVELEFNKIGLFPEYSVILGYHQYDFGFKKYRILIEVQGDYWHANPNLYDINKINHIQQKNINKDINKKKFAEDNNLKIYYIWESDIKNNNFKVLKEIYNEIQIIEARN